MTVRGASWDQPPYHFVPALCKQEESAARHRLDSTRRGSVEPLKNVTVVEAETGAALLNGPDLADHARWFTVLVGGSEADPNVLWWRRSVPSNLSGLAA